MKQIIKINKGLISQEADNKISIFDPDESILFTLNETASFIFKQIKKGATNDMIIKKLVERYGISEEIATKDVSNILKDLGNKQIILKE